MRTGLGVWRTSLQAKVVFSTLALTLLALAVVGTIMSSTIRDGIFDKRVAILLQDSARAASNAQSTFNASTASNGTQVQQLLNDMLASLQTGGSGERDVFLWHSGSAPGSTPGSAFSVNDISTAPELIELVGPALRAAVTADGGSQYWQSVAIPESDHHTPGVLIGSAVEVPVAGTFELYFLYSLSTEQQTLVFIQQVLGLASLLLIVLLGSLTWLVTRQVVRPVSEAASVAERLADGHLAERLKVRGVDELATLGTSFNSMAESLQEQIEQLAELSAMQRRFVSDVSHELRTPLTTVRMAAEVLYAGRDDFAPGERRSAELLTNQLDRFESLLADLLEISRFDARAAVLEAEQRDVRALVELVAEGVAPLAESKGIPIELDVPAGDMSAEIDSVRVQRIVRNLLVNAIEHADGSAVEVRMAADKNAVAIRVVDHGVGLSPDDLTHVFDRFWRADPARARTTGGTGLGLSISREDALLHDGRLEVWGRLGEGASFLLTLPRRAGMGLRTAPLPLVPQELLRQGHPADRPTSDHGPAALPPLTDLEEQR